MFKQKVEKTILELAFLDMELNESSIRDTISITFLLLIKGESFLISKSELEIKLERLEAP